MKLFILFLFMNVYPLQEGEPAPEPVVAFDTTGAKRLLYMLDSLSFVTGKLSETEKLVKKQDTLIQSYKEKIDILVELEKTLKEENKVLKEKLKLESRRKWFERFIWIGGVSVLLILFLGR